MQIDGGTVKIDGGEEYCALVTSVVDELGIVEIVFAGWGGG